MNGNVRIVVTLEGVCVCVCDQRARDTSGVPETTFIFIWVMVTWMYAHVQINQLYV